MSLPHVGGGEVGVGGGVASRGHHHNAAAPKSAGQLLVALQSQLGRVKRLDGGGGGSSGGTSRRESRMVGHPGMTPLGDSSITITNTQHFNTSRTAPHNGLPSRRESTSRPGTAGGGVVRSTSSGDGTTTAAASPLEINNLKREFLRKLVFMKNVYESRISELEERVDSLLKQVSGKQQQPPQQPFGMAGASTSLMTAGGNGGGAGPPTPQQYQPLWSFTPDPNAVPPKAKSPPRGTTSSTTSAVVADAAGVDGAVAPTLHPTFSTAGYMPPVVPPTAPTKDPTDGAVDVEVVDAHVKALEGLGCLLYTSPSPRDS
eukprot:TRINITY_DN6906_c0_g1_i2.p1 TRINITY_DN6906_c0_g1~~TRINITY_DN6906_c0_g1_i2.p1  ORF type:complete len:316 (-),score=64.09 TRINITY_DN6906_c0_g1_i2:167-1114(-)